MDGRGRWDRWDKKATTNQYNSLDLTAFARRVDMTQPISGSLHWNRSNYFGESKSSISYEVIPRSGVRLIHKSGDDDKYNYIVRVTTTTPNYGGVRYWWLCPNCNRRVRILYGGRYFLCRHCHDLTYVTTQSGGDRLYTIADRLERLKKRLQGSGDSLKGPWEKPRGMHWSTYQKLVCEYLNLRQLWNLVWLGGAVNAMGCLDIEGSSPLTPEEVQAEIDAEWKAYKDSPFLFGEMDAEGWISQPKGKQNRLTLGEIARLAEVSYEFACEARQEGLINPDQGRGKRRRRYRRKLASWLGKLYQLRKAGITWEEIREWSARRWQPGREHERRWPAGFDLSGIVGDGARRSDVSRS